MAFWSSVAGLLDALDPVVHFVPARVGALDILAAVQVNGGHVAIQVMHCLPWPVRLCLQSRLRVFMRPDWMAETFSMRLRPRSNFSSILFQYCVEVGQMASLRSWPCSSK